MHRPLARSLAVAALVAASVAALVVALVAAFAAPLVAFTTPASPRSAAAFTLIAHRGASWDAPENTFAAWDLALADGADWIEQDLRLTRDGVLVVIHDDSLDRTMRGPPNSCTGPVRDRTLTELGRCDAGSWFNAEHPARASDAFARERIPTLDSVLARYAGRARFYVEIKDPAEAPGMEQVLIALVRAHGLIGRGGETGRLIIQSFSEASLRQLHATEPALRLVQLLEDPLLPDSVDATLERIAGYAAGIGPSRRILTPRMVERAHAHGLFVHAYTANDLPVVDWLRGIGVDGAFTDRPGLLRRHIDR